MVATSDGASGLALLLAGSGGIPNFLCIGSGSGTAISTASWLYGDLDLPEPFSARTISTPKETEFQSDWSANELSGLTLTNFIKPRCAMEALL